MSSESSFDAQLFNEFDDFVPKPHSTDSLYSSDPESPHADISSQGPLPPITIPPATPGFSGFFCKLDIAPQDTDSLPNRRLRGRPFKRTYVRSHTLGKANTKEDPLVKPADHITKMSKPRGHKFLKTHPRRGYCSKFRILVCNNPRELEFTTFQGDTKRIVSKPKGMRILDVGILSEVFSTIRCNNCNGTQALYEEEWKHCWQTFFRVKCPKCNSEDATFPSSRSLDIPSNHTCVNVPFTPKDMNEVTMRSVLATHSTGISWRDLHKIATVFDLPPPSTGLRDLESIMREVLNLDIRQTEGQSIRVREVARAS